MANPLLDKLKQDKTGLSDLLTQEAIKYAHEKMDNPSKEDMLFVMGCFLKAGNLVLDYYNEKIGQ